MIDPISELEATQRRLAELAAENERLRLALVAQQRVTEAARAWVAAGRAVRARASSVATALSRYSVARYSHDAEYRRLLDAEDAAEERLRQAVEQALSEREGAMTVTRILALWEATDSGDSRIDHGALVAFARRVEALALDRAAQAAEDCHPVTSTPQWTAAQRAIAKAVRALGNE